MRFGTVRAPRWFTTIRPAETSHRSGFGVEKLAGLELAVSSTATVEAFSSSAPSMHSFVESVVCTDSWVRSSSLAVVVDGALVLLQRRDVCWAFLFLILLRTGSSAFLCCRCLVSFTCDDDYSAIAKTVVPPENISSSIACYLFPFFSCVPKND